MLVWVVRMIVGESAVTGRTPVHSAIVVGRRPAMPEHSKQGVALRPHQCWVQRITISHQSGISEDQCSAGCDLGHLQAR
jgi:hypothetical protein